MQRKNTGWFKPYVLNHRNVERVITEERPGVYVLGSIGPDQKLQIKHIKTSNEAKTELTKLIGKYQVFMYKPFKHLLGNRPEQQPLFTI